MRVSYLIWNNDHGGWWGPDRGGYTTSLERAGRYDGDEATTIVDSASVDGHLYHPDGRVLPDVMVVAPEHRTAGCDVSAGDGRPVDADELARIKALCEQLERISGVRVGWQPTGIRNEPGIELATQTWPVRPVSDGPRCPDPECGEPLADIASGAVGHCGRSCAPVSGEQPTA